MEDKNQKYICFSDSELSELKKQISDTALIQAKAHIEPSEETKKTFKIMNDELTNIKLSLVEIKTDTKYSKEKLDAHISKEDEFADKLAEANEKAILKMTEAHENFIETASKTFASKTTEKIVYGVVAIILTSFIYALIRYVMPNNSQLTTTDVQKLIEANNDKYFEKN